MPAVGATPQILVQSVIAATGSARAAAKILGVNRHVIHALREGKAAPKAAANLPKIQQGYLDKANKDPAFRSKVGAANDVLSRFKPENRPAVTKEAVSKEGRAAFQAKMEKENKAWANKIKRSSKANRSAARERYGKNRGWTNFTPSGHPKK